jgi:peptidoglycan/LPS O-acetylase OafA/YrhL
MPALSYVTFTQNIFMGIRNTFGATWMAPTWSLAVEEQFYLVLPALVSVLSPKALRRVIVVAIVTAPAFRAAASALVGQVEMPMRADSLLLGVMVALCVRDARFVERLRRNVRAYYAAFVLLLLGAAVMCVKGSWFGVFTQTWLAATYATLLLAPFADAAGLSRVLRANALRFFGKLSYSLYLTHLIVAGLLHGLVYGREPRIDDLGSAALTTGSFLLSVGISYALFRSIETPAIAYGHRRVKRVGIAATA